MGSHVNTTRLLKFSSLDAIKLPTTLQELQALAKQQIWSQTLSVQCLRSLVCYLKEQQDKPMGLFSILTRPYAVSISTNLKINFCAQSKYKCMLQSVSTFQVFLISMEAVITFARKLNNRQHFQSILSLPLLMHSNRQQHLRICNAPGFAT